MSALEQQVHVAFAQHFGGRPDVMVQAPGRVNLIGEHTDYNDGFVLPCAIDFRTVIAARRRADRMVRVIALDEQAALDEFSLDPPIPRLAAPLWPNYVRGMVAMMQAAGWALGGADLVIAGDVPQGAGLSSSASLEVGVGQAFRALGDIRDLQPPELARLAQRAENEFVGCQCGVMDQMVSAAGVAGHALLLDCRSLHTTPVPLPPGLVVLILNSNVRRGLVGSEYNLRREQCEAAARHFGVAALRDLDRVGLAAGQARLDATLLRRARHVVTENERTLAAAGALASGDLFELSRLMADSHASMRDDFEITTPAIDELVRLVADEIGSAGGARMTGGGFGGCVVALTSAPLADAAMQRVARDYRSPEGLPATAFLCSAAAGAGPIPSCADELPAA